MHMRTAITPTRAENYPLWYQEVITQADLAQLSPVRGCMIMTPWGYALWEMIQKKLDYEIKLLEHENIYCPLFVPLSDLRKEAEHVDGFAKECAVVTHTKLEKDQNGNLVPASPLEEPLVIRPTSEMIIGTLFSQKIQSHRDLPLLVNQWANIVRWEMRTRMFLRTTEFLWQEGHTAHQSEQEAHAHTITMLKCYRSLCHDFLAIPVVTGKKSKNEKFPGAVETYTIEGIMQDGKALQMGTSHYLGQTFAKSCNIQYQDADKQLQYVHTTSWGVTTRLIGGIIMTHADDNGLICPPTLAPYQIVIIPVYKKNSDEVSIMQYCKKVKSLVENQPFLDQKIRVLVDKKNKKPGDKKWDWVKKGVPIRIEIGQRECDEQTVCFTSRLDSVTEKQIIAVDQFKQAVAEILSNIQDKLYQRACNHLSSEQCPLISSIPQFEKHFSGSSPGPVLIYWFENDTTEKKLQEQFKVSIRCYPDKEIFPYPETNKSLFDPEIDGHLALVAKAY